MIKLLPLILMLLTARSFGMDRISALSMIESGDDDRKVGRHGEISRYQILKVEWRKVTQSLAYRDPKVSLFVARKILNKRTLDFEVKFRRPPTNTEFYALWNAPAQVMKGRISPVVMERCRRFDNLCRKR